MPETRPTILRAPCRCAGCGAPVAAGTLAVAIGAGGRDDDPPDVAHPGCVRLLYAAPAAARTLPPSTLPFDA
jgi:hypothetical protein